ncbi:MAG: hypothetical protein AAGJ53_09025, partial [Pseudomonadota bacterium]
MAAPHSPWYKGLEGGLEGRANKRRGRAVNAWQQDSFRMNTWNTGSGTALRRSMRISAAAVAALFTVSTVSGAFAQGATAQASRTPDYSACQTKDDATFEAAIRSITGKALQQGLAGIDFEAVVRSEWRKGQVSDVVDKRVEIAAAAIRSESTWSSLLKSLAYRKRARELATAVAERVYRSDAVKTAISGLATGVGTEIGRAIEISTIDAAGPAEACVKAFLSDRYGTTIAGAVQADARQSFTVGAEAGSANIGASAVLL